MTQSDNHLGTRFGLVALLGAPNAGKSTLLNALVGQPLAITSAKPQTTRQPLLGISIWEKSQIGFLDTPGLFAAAGNFEKKLVAAAREALHDADVRVLVVDASRSPAPALALVPLLSPAKPNFLVFNKTDAVTPKTKLLQLVSQFQGLLPWQQIFMVSAKAGDGIKDLIPALAAAVPAGPWHYDAEQVTDWSERDLAAEVTREQLYHLLYQELPYAATVRPVSWQERPNGSLAIAQEIVVQRTSQRAIVLGKGGQQLKAIGIAAREALTARLGRKVHLQLQVVVDENWQAEPPATGPGAMA